MRPPAWPVESPYGRQLRLVPDRRHIKPLHNTTHNNSTAVPSPFSAAHHSRYRAQTYLFVECFVGAVDVVGGLDVTQLGVHAWWAGRNTIGCAYQTESV